MSVVSITFMIALLVVAGVIFFLPRGLPRQILLALCNAIFLYYSVPNWQSWISLAVFILSAYFVGEVVRKIEEPRNRSRIVTTYIALLVAAFVVLKEYQFLSFVIPPGTISRYISIVGISYMLFRQIHYVIDVSEGQIERTSIWVYLNYQLDLFALYAGPIQRYEQFSECWTSLTPVLVDHHDRLKAIARLMIGILKVSVLGAYALRLSEKGGDQQVYARSVHGLIFFAMLFYAYPAYIYFNFSGYCDVVIAGASLVGIRLPENFNHPYLARNPIDFWTRWHMSLTNWIRDYVFTPLYKKGAENSIVKPARLSYVCFFIALFLAGVWHGSTWNFVVFGVLHGCGVSIAKMWEEHIIRTKGRPGLKSYLKSTPIRVVATIGTVHFVCLTLLFFPTDLAGRVQFLRLFVTGRP
jgi:D-alanyl-lipoteichoic acid acyltransferase DltB (MBOAT superfamily)